MGGAVLDDGVGVFQPRHHLQDEPAERLLGGRLARPRQELLAHGLPVDLLQGEHRIDAAEVLVEVAEGPGELVATVLAERSADQEDVVATGGLRPRRVVPSDRVFQDPGHDFAVLGQPLADRGGDLMRPLRRVLQQEIDEEAHVLLRLPLPPGQRRLDRRQADLERRVLREFLLQIDGLARIPVTPDDFRHALPHLRVGVPGAEDERGQERIIQDQVDLIFFDLFKRCESRGRVAS